MMAASIREEIRRLHRKKQLHFSPKLAESTSPPETVSDTPGSPPSSFSSVFPANNPDKPLFTFRQVCLVTISSNDNINLCMVFLHLHYFSNIYSWSTGRINLRTFN